MRTKKGSNTSSVNLSRKEGVEVKTIEYGVAVASGSLPFVSEPFGLRVRLHAQIRATQ